jgi:hypothetical protein
MFSLRPNGATPLLGPMPEVRQLASDPKQITVLNQYRERYLEVTRVERMLTDSSDATPAPEMKQLPEAA